MNEWSNKNTILIIKHIIRVIIQDYFLHNNIYNLNCLRSQLTNIIWKGLTNCNLYTHTRGDILLKFFEKNLIRGAIIPNTFQQLLLEIIEILERIITQINSNLIHQLF
jgi:hypothetical protein